MLTRTRTMIDGNGKVQLCCSVFCHTLSLSVTHSLCLCLSLSFSLSISLSRSLPFVLSFFPSFSLPTLCCCSLSSVLLRIPILSEPGVMYGSRNEWLIPSRNSRFNLGSSWCRWWCCCCSIRASIRLLGRSDATDGGNVADR